MDMTYVTPDYVFPTCVGMNRQGLPKPLSRTGVPHVCGDEPAITDERDIYE